MTLPCRELSTRWSTRRSLTTAKCAFSRAASLYRRTGRKEVDAFEALTNRYEQRVYSLALRILRQEQDAEDVTQQAFLSALENLNGFRGDASFVTWLLRIATHAALKAIRK